MLFRLKATTFEYHRKRRALTGVKQDRRNYGGTDQGLLAGCWAKASQPGTLEELQAIAEGLWDAIACALSSRHSRRFDRHS